MPSKVARHKPYETEPAPPIPASGIVTRHCPCGATFQVPYRDKKKWFCNDACKREVQIRVCRNIIQNTKRIGAWKRQIEAEGPDNQ